MVTGHQVGRIGWCKGGLTLSETVLSALDFKCSSRRAKYALPILATPEDSPVNYAFVDGSIP